MDDIDELAEVLRKQFAEAELHVFIVTAEQKANADAPHWKRLRAAAIKASGCVECARSAR